MVPSYRNIAEHKYGTDRRGEGQFKDNQRDSNWTLFSIDGYSLVGKWKDDNLVM